MATRQPAFNNDASKDASLKVATWSGLLNGDDGAWIRVPDYRSLTFQVLGTLGVGGTVALEGTNEDTPTNPSTLTNQATGVALSLTALGLATAGDRPLWVRPRVTGGDGTTSLSVILAAGK